MLCWGISSYPATCGPGNATVPGAQGASFMPSPGALARCQQVARKHLVPASLRFDQARSPDRKQSVRCFTATVGRPLALIIF